MPEVGESGAMPGLHVGEAVVNTDGPGAAVADVYMAGDSAGGEGQCTPPTSSATNEDCTHTVTEGRILRQWMIPGWSPSTMHH